MEGWCVHGRIGWCPYCEEELDSIELKMSKLINRSENDELAKERWQADLEFSRKPWWVQATEEGDYLADGSDLQGYDKEEK